MTEVAVRVALVVVVAVQLGYAALLLWGFRQRGWLRAAGTVLLVRPVVLVWPFALVLVFDPDLPAELFWAVAVVLAVVVVAITVWTRRSARAAGWIAAGT